MWLAYLFSHCIAGDLERLRRYWMTGSCKPGKEQHKSSDPLALEQFLSAFLLLMLGVLLAAALLLGEHLYFKCVRKHLIKTDRGGCCALVSLVSKDRNIYSVWCYYFIKKSLGKNNQTVQYKNVQF